ncbi:MAG: SRPBCC family protein [Candidatus Eremiobacteraeota bacterium]|nr:SRPBCC family protein [Candidatus Eremiobacteraeota bacterium]
MFEHRASVRVPASSHQVYEMFSHFNDFPKFMSYVKEVTYRDDRTSHWVAEIAGTHEWTAVNENWSPDRRIGWRSTEGLKNEGSVTFEDRGPGETQLEVVVRYDPPAGILGDAGEKLGVGAEFERRLQHDLNRFAEMVRSAPAGALDPASSSYLFRAASAAGEG